MQKILEKIKTCQNGRSVSDFARLLGMKQPSVHFYLSGQRKLSLEFIYSVCDKCHVSADWLLGLSDARAPSETPRNVPQSADIIAEKDRKILALENEIKGLRYAVDALAKGGQGAPDSARRGRAASSVA